MIDGIITIEARDLGDSPTGYEFTLSAKCTCGCEYALSFVSYSHNFAKRLDELRPAYQRISHWLKNDRHGSQLFPSPLDQIVFL